MAGPEQDPTPSDPTSAAQAGSPPDDSELNLSARSATDGDAGLDPTDDPRLSEARDTEAEPQASAGEAAEAATQVEIARSREDADDDVHFGVAAKALGVSRKTVERMVKRGQLQRGPSGAPATVSKRALVAVLEQRRRDLTKLARSGSEDQGDPDLAPATVGEEEEWDHLVSPLLRPLLDELVAARNRAAMLERELDRVLTERSADERDQEALLRALSIGGWRERRKARRAAIRRYVMHDADPSR